MARSLARVRRIVLLDDQDAQYLQLGEAEPEGGAGADAGDAEPRSLTMVIGRASAEEIARLLQGARAPRPMTHELAHEVLRKLGGRVRELEIHSLRDGTFFADLTLEDGDRVFSVDCRPSDGIPLTLLAGAPIYVREEVWREAARGPEQGPDAGAADEAEEA